MRISNLAFLLWLALSSGAAFPSDARLIITGTFNDLPKDSPDRAFCSNRLSEAAIRHRLRTYHPITFQNVHDSYLWLNCGQQGIIMVSGRQYKWKSYATHIMETTYPDGKLHLLGGAPDGEVNQP